MSDDLKNRVRERLDVLNRNPFDAARIGGLERSFINDFLIGKKKSVTYEKLRPLAKALDWSLAQLLEIDGADSNSPNINYHALSEAIAGSFRMLGIEEEEIDNVLKLIFEIAQEKPTPSSGPNYHRVLSESVIRKFLELKRIQSN